VVAALNHTIVHARDARESAAFLAAMLDLAEPFPFGPFIAVPLDHGLTLDLVDHGDGDIAVQHYAFLVSEEQFDRTYGRIVERGLEHWADPGQDRPGEVNSHDGGRGVYWRDPAGHFLEIITRPYGSGSMEDGGDR
jgi:hypothetical protein